jgi:hypothetical protein
MANHSKCNVKVVSSTGEAWTTKRGARRMIGRGLAVQLASGVLQMVETDPRFACETPSASGPQLVVMPAPDSYYQPDTYLFDGFLPYPQARQESIARGLKGKYPAIGRRAA